MPRAPRERRGQARGRLERRVAQARHAEPLACRGALGAALVVARAGVRVTLAGVERHQPVTAELERAPADLERAEVDPHRPIALAEQRGELVEQTGLRADPVVLDPRAELRQLDPVELRRVGERDQRERQRDLERGRGRQARRRAARRRRSRSRAPRSGTPARCELAGRAAHERATSRAPARGPVELERVVARSRSGAIGLDPCAPTSAVGAHRHAVRDRERQREPLVVVGVLADQVDPPGGERGDVVGKVL